MAETDPKLKNQSLVKIIQVNQQYPNGITEIEDNDPRIVKSFTRNRDPELSHVYVIQFSAKNKSRKEWVYYIRSITDGSGYFFAERGLVPHHNLKDALVPDQKIRLKRGWQKNMDGSGYDFSEMAKKWSGTVVTITSVFEGECNEMFARIAEDNEYWKWFPNMFDFFDKFDNPVIILRLEDLKPGSKLRMREEGLVNGKPYGNNCWINGMAEPGELVTVRTVTYGHFCIDRTVGKGVDTCSYTLEMTTGELISVPEAPVPTIPDTAFEPGDKVRVRMDLVHLNEYGGWRPYTDLFGKQGTEYTFVKYEDRNQRCPKLYVKECKYAFGLGMLEFVERPASHGKTQYLDNEILRKGLVMHKMADVILQVNKPQIVHLAASTLLHIKI